MAIDHNYWKDAYKATWEESSDKELTIKQLMEKLANCKCEFIGLGAGKTAIHMDNTFLEAY